MNGREVFLTATDLFLFGCMIFGVFYVSGWFFPRLTGVAGATPANSGPPATVAVGRGAPTTAADASPVGYNAPGRAWGDVPEYSF